jgi:hypothetical protein
MTTNLPPSENEIVRLFSRRFRGWHDFNGGGISRQPCWYSEPRLKDSIINWLACNSQHNIEAFAIYCLANLENKSFALASNHLSAFLENIGFKAAKTVFIKVQQTQNYNQRLPLDNSLDELYQYALLAATNPGDFFENYQPNNCSFKSYSFVKIKGIIYDGVFAKHNTRITGYGALRRLGPRQRRKALELQGYQEPLLSQLCLAWECFYQICTVNEHGRISPTQTDWQNITRQYNRLKRELSAPQNNHNIEYEIIIKWLNDICIPAARNFLFPTFKSIDNVDDNSSLSPVTLVDSSPLPLENFEINELSYLGKELQNNFSYTDILNTLDTQSQTVLLLRYGLQLTQLEVAREMSWLDKNNRPINYKVSRCEDKVIVQLVREISSWLQQEIENQSYPFNTSNNLENLNLNWLKDLGIKPTVEDLLRQYYFTLIDNILKTTILPIDFSNQQLNEMLSQKRENENKLMFMQRISHLQNYEVLAITLLNTHQSTVKQIQTHFNVTFQTGGIAVEKIMVMVLDWLKIYFRQPNN